MPLPQTEKAVDKTTPKNKEELVEKINKKFGDHAIFRMGDQPQKTDIRVLSTGSLSLDFATGVGGLPRGRVIEIFGPEKSGKSMLLLSTIAQTQKSGGYCAFIDVEHALTPSFARLLGVNLDELYLSRPDTGNEALQIMEELIASGMFDIVGLDSVAALTTEAELEGDYNQVHVAALAKMMAQALRNMTAKVSKTQTIAVFINQIREKPMVLFGKSEYTTGGKALKFFASMRIEVRKTIDEKDSKGKIVGHTARCVIEKNKVAPPFSQCEIKLNYTTGIDKLHDLLLIGKQLDIISQSSSWFSYKDYSWNGIEEAKKALVDNGALLEIIHEEIKTKIC